MENEIRLLLAGDISTSRGRDRLHGDFADRLMSEVRECAESADLAVANFENPVALQGTGRPILKSGPNLCGLPDNVDVIKAGGFKCVSLANNHFGDYGEDAMTFTLNHLRKSGIACLGAGANADQAYEAFRFQKHGLRLSLIAACENEFGIAGTASMGTAGFSMGRIYRKIREEKNRSDFVVVFFHGGNENDPFPSPMAAERYRLFVEFGADAVVACHAHCMQGCEIYEGKPIAYGMGNLYFASEEANAPGTAWDYGYMAALRLQPGKAPVMEMIPYRQTPEYDRIVLLRGDEKARVLAYLRDISLPAQDDEQLERLFEGWSLITGPVYAGLLQSDHDGSGQGAAHVLNNFRCEAHRELLKTLFQLKCEGRLEEAEPYRARIEKYQKIPI